MELVGACRKESPDVGESWRIDRTHRANDCDQRVGDCRRP